MAAHKTSDFVIRLHKTLSSCPDDVRSTLSAEHAFRLGGDELVITITSRVSTVSVVYSRGESSGEIPLANTIEVLGCFREGGRFEAASIRKL